MSSLAASKSARWGKEEARGMLGIWEEAGPLLKVGGRSRFQIWAIKTMGITLEMFIEPLLEGFSAFRPFFFFLPINHECRKILS